MKLMKNEAMNLEREWGRVIWEDLEEGKGNEKH